MNGPSAPVRSTPIDLVRRPGATRREQVDHAPVAAIGSASQALLICKKALGQPFRIRQRDEMATRNFIHLLTESFTRNTPLKFDREKTVVSSRKNMNGDIGPALEATGLAENRLGLLAWLFRAGARWRR